MILKKCPKCEAYNLTEDCRKCGGKTEEAHYRFFGLRDAPSKFMRKAKPS